VLGLPDRVYSTARYAPLLVLLPGCATSGRLGPETKLLRGNATAEVQGTVAVGGAGDHAGDGVFLPVLTLSGGVIPGTGRGTGSFEGGGDYAKAVANILSLRLGPRVGGTWGGEAGPYVGLRAGVALALDEPRLDETYPVILLEAFGAPGLGGDISGTFVGGLGLSFGFERYGSFRIPAGRPVRRHGREILAPVARRREWREVARPEMRGVPRTLRRRLGSAWLREARSEHASIATFANLSVQLLARGAPADLVALAHRAALDEVRHARLCFGLASAYLDTEVGPGELPVATPARTSIERLAVESLVDGIVGEGCAAVLAARRRRAARDVAVRRVLGVIAREERRHAELAWAVVAWGVSAGGTHVRAALRDAWSAHVRRPPPRDVAGSELPHHGLPTNRDIGAALARTNRAVDLRLRGLLLAQP
jgi:hypothetical protein